MRLADITLVALGGALGASARFVVGGWLTDRWGAGFPWHTFAINVGGAFLLGLLMSLSLERGALSCTDPKMCRHILSATSTS